MHIGSFPSSPSRRLQTVLAAVAAGHALLAGCVGDVAPAEARPSSVSSQFPTEREQGVAPRGLAPEERLCPDGQPPPSAEGVNLTQVALYQTLKVPLYQDGAWKDQRSVPIVQRKRALVRAFAETLSGYARHPVQGVLRVKNGERVRDFVAQRVLLLGSVENDLDSTFNFDLPGELLGPSTELAVLLEEPDCAAEGGDVAATRAPQQGTRALRAQAIGALRLVLLPMLVEGRLPELDEVQQKNLRDAVLAFFPVAEVEIGMHEPVAFRGDTDGTKFLQELLAVVSQQRLADRPDDDVYYVGLAQPTPSFRTYCATTCTLGLAPPNPRMATKRQVVAGVFYADERGYGTVVHELGHAHGRQHSPCEGGLPVLQPDPDYPHRDGRTGSWGWDFRSGALVPPTHKDIMSYCSPPWISPHHYAALAERSFLVNRPAPALQALMLGEGTRDRYRTLLLREDGQVRWLSGFTAAPSTPERERAVALDAQNRVVAEIAIERTPLSETRGEFVSIPEPGADWHAIEWIGRRVALSQVLPPL